jgi:acid phosphatase type 7
MKRRSFLSNLGKTSLLAGFGFGTNTFPAVAGIAEKPGKVSPDAHVFLTQPYLQQPAADSIRVRWITNRKAFSWLEFGEGSAPDRKAQQSSQGFVHANNRINEVILQGLKPGTTYKYRIASKDIIDFHPYNLKYGETIYSDIYQFTTSHKSPAEVSWLVMNDIHDRPYSIPHLMKLNGEDPYDFVFFNGDMFDYQTDEQQLIDHMIKPCTDAFASQVPFYFVRGNHETRGKFARELGDYFSNPNQKYYGSYEWGPVHAIVLDTGEDKADDHPVYGGIVDFDAYREEQLPWLEKEMQKPAFKKAKFRVVMMHIPHYYSGEGHGTLHCRKLFAPLFNKYKIDLFLAGHTHKYGVFQPKAGEHDYPIVIGGGPREGNRTLIKIKADQKNLKLTMLRDDGAEVGKVELRSKR